MGIVNPHAARPALTQAAMDFGFETGGKSSRPSASSASGGESRAGGESGLECRWPIGPSTSRAATTAGRLQRTACRSAASLSAQGSQMMPAAPCGTRQSTSTISARARRASSMPAASMKGWR